jgi:hypothetical protein
MTEYAPKVCALTGLVLSITVIITLLLYWAH